MDGEIRTHLNAGVHRTPAATSSQTGGYNNFLSPMRKKMQIESTIRNPVPTDGAFCFGMGIWMVDSLH